MNMQSQSEAANSPQKNYREISSWLKGMRERGGKKERMEDNTAADPCRRG
jgi:hypothetical protein